MTLITGLSHLLGNGQYLLCRVTPGEDADQSLHCSINKEVSSKIQKDACLTPGHREYAFNYQLSDGRALNDWGCNTKETCAMTYRSLKAGKLGNILTLPLEAIISLKGCSIVTDKGKVDVH